MNKKTIILLHGWNYLLYSKYCTDSPWADKQTFVALLKKHFTVIEFVFPGFCGVPDPNEPWQLEDFATFVQREIVNQGIQDPILLGFSFGGAVALAWKVNTKSAQPVILVAPALKRNYAIRSSSFFARLGKLLPDFLRNIGRSLLMRFVWKNQYYVRATSVMRQTYRRIVALDTAHLLEQCNIEEACLIYGEYDTATPGGLVKEFADIHIIPGAGHTVLKEQPMAVIEIINQFLTKKQNAQ